MNSIIDNNSITKNNNYGGNQKRNDYRLSSFYVVKWRLKIFKNVPRKYSGNLSFLTDSK